MTDFEKLQEFNRALGKAYRDASKSGDWRAFRAVDLARTAHIAMMRAKHAAKGRAA